MPGNPFDGLGDLGGLFDVRTGPTPLPQIRGKEIGGVLYVRAEDVADALESQAPRSCARLIAKLRRRP